MPNKELTVKVSMDTKSATSSIANLEKRLQGLYKTLDKASEKDVAIDKQIAQYEKLRLTQEKLALAREKFNSQEAMQMLKLEQQEADRIAKQEANVDKMLQKEMDAMHKKQQAQWKAFEKEVAQYEKELQKEQALIQKEMEKERLRQQSLHTLTQTDKAGQRIANNMERLKRAEYEAWWEAQLIKQEWEKAHPVLTKLNNNFQKILSKHPKLQIAYDKSLKTVSNISDKARTWAANQKLVTNAARSTNSVLDGVWSKLKGIAATYLGVMGTRAIVDTTDLLVGAENRLNYVTAGELGDSGYNADGTYSNKTLNATQEALDKMYVSSQKVRTSYQDMISNVSKTMTLAGDAFKGNINTAIRFQEIMAEAYAVGGASAQEMSTSMYQLTQALGSGVLQGDELRSVREGAPLAYQAIEEFAQGVLKSEESLKELASQGKITSDMVVASIMDMGSKVDKAFGQTRQTFGQTFNQIKNSALYAFQPVMQLLTDALNKAVDSGMIQRFEMLFTGVAKVIMIVFKLIEVTVNFIKDNFSTIVKIITTIVIALGILLIPKLIEIITLLGIKIAYYILVGIEAVAAAIKAFVAWALVNWQMALFILVIAAVVVAIIWMADSFADACGMIVGSVFWVQAVIYNVVAFIVNLLTGMFNAILLITQNIGIAFYNAWQSAKASFWEWVAECLNGTGMIAKAVNKIASLFGLDTVSIETKIDSAKSKIKDYNGTEDILAGFTAVEYKNLGDSYDKGYDIGSNWGQSVTDKLGGGLDKIGKKLGLNFEGMGQFPTIGVDGSYSPDLDKLAGNVGDIDSNTGKIADSMDLTQEDLEYLRRIADMEWKKEYTTANITVDMSNYNTINGESDLDGIVTKLADKLYEEMQVVADGVYVY